MGKEASEPFSLFALLQGVKYVASTLLTAAAIAFICYGMGTDQAVLPGPPPLHFGVLVFVLVLLAYLEGLQVAILALETAEGARWKETHPRAYKLHSLVTQGKNVTTFPSLQRPELFPEVLWFILVETALPGALIVLAFGQLMPQLIASRYPVMFCNMYGAMTVLHMTLILESIGVTHFSWLLTGIVSWAFNLEKTEGAERRIPAAGVPAGPCGQLLERLVGIQDSWRHMGQSAPRLDLLGCTGVQQAGKELFITPDMAQEALKSVGKDDVEWDGKGTTPKADKYPTPAEIAAHLVAKGQDVPCFLLPPDHSLHVPPHILAYSLMSSIAQGVKAKPIGTEEVDINV